MQTQTVQTKPRPINQIAAEIYSVWPNVNYAAAPYLEAMRHLKDKHDKYFEDSAKSVVLYFLANAGSFRGDAARRIKAELKEIVK